MGKSIEKNIKIIRKFLDGDINYIFDENDKLFRFKVQFSALIGIGQVCIMTDEDYVSCVMIPPMSVPVARRDDINRLISMINYRIVFGHFDQDITDGEIRFIYPMPSEELYDNKKEKVQRLLLLPMDMWKKFGSAFMKVIMGGSMLDSFIQVMGIDENEAKAVRARYPEELFSECEKDDNDEDVSNECKIQSSAKITKKGVGDAKKKSSDLPELVRDYSLDGLNIKGEIKLARIVNAVRNFDRMIKEGKLYATGSSEHESTPVGTARNWQVGVRELSRTRNRAQGGGEDGERHPQSLGWEKRKSNQRGVRGSRA